jgi:hypothetical protein
VKGDVKRVAFSVPFTEDALDLQPLWLNTMFDTCLRLLVGRNDTRSHVTFRFLASLPSTARRVRAAEENTIAIETLRRNFHAHAPFKLIEYLITSGLPFLHARFLLGFSNKFTLCFSDHHQNIGFWNKIAARIATDSVSMFFLSDSETTISAEVLMQYMLANAYSSC